MVTLDVAQPARDATSAELSQHADQLRASITAARQGLESQVSEAFTRRLRENLPKVERSDRQRPGAARPPGRALAEGETASWEVAAKAGLERVAREISQARQALADNLSRCDPADVERLERLALALGESGTAGVHALEQSVAESVEHSQRARQAAISRQRLRVLLADAMPAERRTLAEMLGTVPDSGLPTLTTQVEAAVARADRHRSRVQVARAAAGALRDLGCDVGTDFATFLSATDTAIVPMRDFPGYGLRVSLSSTSLQTLVVRHGGLARGRDTAVQQAVCDRMDGAWAGMRRTGVVLTEQHRTGAGAEPVPAVGERQWDAEIRVASAGSAPGLVVAPAADPGWLADDDPGRELRYGG